MVGPARLACSVAAAMVVDGPAARARGFRLPAREQDLVCAQRLKNEPAPLVGAPAGRLARGVQSYARMEVVPTAAMAETPRATKVTAACAVNKGVGCGANIAQRMIDGRVATAS